VAANNVNVTNLTGDEGISIFVGGAGVELQEARTRVKDIARYVADNGGGTPGGNTTEVQFNNAGEFGGNAGFTFVDDGETGETLTIGEAVIWQNAGVEITTIPQATKDTDGIKVSITAGDANGEATGGEVVIEGGSTTGKYEYGGGVLIKGGAGNGDEATGGAVNIDAGQGKYRGGYIQIQAGGGEYGGNVGIDAGSSSAANAGGNVTLTSGTSVSGKGGDIILHVSNGGGGLGTLRITNANVANSTTACVLTAASGPDGAQTGVQGWLKIDVGGTDRFIPFW
jgi:hypothetical protein